MGLASALLYGLAGKVLNGMATKHPKCWKCKVSMEKGESLGLFLLPVHSDKDYEPSVSYYLKGCVPIRDESQIPTSQRACRIYPMVCPRCDRKMARVEDFLRVRDQEALEKVYDCDYEELLPLITAAAELTK